MAHRSFTDLRGTTWQVWDVIPRVEPSEEQLEAGLVPISEPLIEGWLAFQAGETRRRLVPIPDGWYEASDAQLRHWCTEAAAVAPRRTSGETRPSLGQ